MRLALKHPLVMLGTELIRQRTKKLGYAATDAEVLAAIREVPAFQVDGKFSPDAYHAALRSINMSPERFEAEQREYVLARQLDRGLYSSAFVLPAELERRVALLGETRTLGWVAVPARDRDRLDDLLAPRPLELGELGLECGVLFAGHVLTHEAPGYRRSTRRQIFRPG